jgi:gold/copper resistance efflux system membrane fusion protein
VVATAVMVTGWLAVAGQDRPAAPSRPPARAPAPEVEVVTVSERVLPEVKQFTGRLSAVEHVELRPRVGGYVAAVRFAEGSLVRRGQLLFELDARPFAAAHARARAQLAQAEERRALAARKAARARALRDQDVISLAELEAATAEDADAVAAVHAAEAWLRAATIDLSDTRVRSPIDGRVGEAFVTTGNLVSGGSSAATLLTTIVSVDPIRVEFDVDEATFQRLAASRVDGQGEAPVTVVLADESGSGHAARVDYLANRVDPATGTARARAVLANQDGRLTPGQFARVRLEVGAPRPVAIVPAAVIGTSAQGRHVLVVTAAGVVEARGIEVGEVADGMQVVRRGLAAGEQVIVKGMARPGMTVTPVLASNQGGGS